ncbi:PH domain-containing protein [Rhodococcus sp. NPDC058505]|uniref:PH domain-containing protein n=1 Tax=unclassified Rhodococcus (in: high G+C Gram-positive bacteria) TaxID=192944 RepID=UPI0036506FAC
MSTPPTAVVTMADPRWRPSRRAPLLWALGAALGWAAVFVAQMVWGFVDRAWTTWPHVAVFAATALAAVAHVFVVPRWRYRVHRWEISDTAVYTRTGWFTQERRIAPISRIQTVDTERGPLERMLGLATVTVTTASSAGAVRIEALDSGVADAAVTRLTEIAGRNVGDAT